MRTGAKLAAVLLGASVCAGSVSAVTPQDVEAAATRPDIVLFMVDDFGYLPGGPVIKRLPNINRIFKQQGKQLRRIYNETPLCGPSRANILTGQHTRHHGVTNNNGARLNFSRTIFPALRAAGHHVGVTGKLINNVDKGKVKGIDHYLPLHDAGRSATLRQKSINLVESAPTDKPLFAMISTTAPHSPTGSRLPTVENKYRGAAECAGIGKFKPPTYTVGKSKSFPRNMPKWYGGWPLKPICEALLPFDQTVGAVVAAQKERGRDAWLIFMSDNGMAYGQFGYPSKVNPHATRGVFYVNGPGVAAGTGSEKLLSFIDIAPTVAQLGNAKMPWVDGRSFVPHLKGNMFTGRARMLEYMPHPDPKIAYSANRKVKWNLVRWNNGRKRLTRPNYQVYEWTNYATRKPWMTRTMSKELSYMVKNSRY